VGCTMAGMIALSPKSDAKQPVAPTVPTTCVSAGPESGIASWYGAERQGKPTASGELFDKDKLTAAHRTLRMGTKVSVTNLKNHRSVQVRINDRGPGIPGRIVDVSAAAAERLNFVRAGLVPVQIDIISCPTAKYASSRHTARDENANRIIGGKAPLKSSADMRSACNMRDHTSPGIFAVQVGAFRDRSNAEHLQDVIAGQFGPVSMQGYDHGNTIFYLVRVGQQKTEAAARDLARDLHQAGWATEMLVVRVD
jgi:rare lipoprotein A